MKNRSLCLAAACLLASLVPASGQDLADVLSSIQERKLLLEQAQALVREDPNFSPGYYHPGGNSGTFELISWTGSPQFPTTGDLTSLSIEGRVRLLNEARRHFQIIRAGYVNVSPERLDGTEGVRPPAVIRRFDELSLPTPPVADHANYIQVLRELACKVDALRVTPWPVEYTLTTGTVDNGTGESPQSSGADKFEWSELNQSSTATKHFWAPEQPVRASYEVGGLNYATNVGTEEEPEWEPREFRRIRRYWPSDFTLAFAPTGLSLPSGVSAVEGSCVVLAEQLNSPYLGAVGTGSSATPIPQEGGYKVLSSETSAGAKSITPPEWVVSGSWVASGAANTAFRQNEQVFKPTSGTSTLYDSQFSNGYLYTYTCIEQNVVFLLLPTFTLGLDASSSVDYAWDRPAVPGDPGMVSASGGAAKLAVDAGRGEAMFVGGSIQIQHGWTEFPGISGGVAQFPAAMPEVLWGHPNESLEYLDYFTDKANHRSVPLSFGTQLRFAGPERDYQVFYETRFDQGRATLEDWPETSVGISGHGWPHGMAYYWEWQKPRLRQVLGREALIDVTVGADDFVHTVSIYRVPVGHTISYDADGFVETSGLALLKTVTIDGASRDAEGFPSNGLALSVDADGGEWTVQGSSGTDPSGYPVDWDVTLNASGGSPVILEEDWSTVVDYTATDPFSNAIGFEAPIMQSFEVVATSDGSAATETTSNFTTVSVRSLVADPLPRISNISQASGSDTATIALTYESGANSPEFPTTITTNVPDEPQQVTKLETSGVPDYVTRGSGSTEWKTDWDLDANGLLEAEHSFGQAVYSRDWTKWEDGGWTVTRFSDPRGAVDSLDEEQIDESIDWSKLEFGTVGGSGFVGLPRLLTRKDGSGATWLWTVNGDGSTSLDHQAGFLTGGSVTRGSKTLTGTNERGYPTGSETFLIQGSASLKTGGSSVPSGQFTAWGAPTKFVDYLTGLESSWTPDGNRERPSSTLSPLGVTTAFNSYDALDRLKTYQLDAENEDGQHDGSLTYNGSGFGVSNTLTISGLGNRGSDFTEDAFGRLLSATAHGARPLSLGVARANGNTTSTLQDTVAGKSLIQVFKDADGSFQQESGTVTLPKTGADLAITNGLLVRGSTVTGLGNASTVSEDAWGRTINVATPDTSGASTSTGLAYSPPGDSTKKVTISYPSGRVFISEIDALDEAGIVRREGWKKTGTGEFADGDRYWETRTSIDGTELTIVVYQNEDAGLREVTRTVLNPVTRETVTKINRNEAAEPGLPEFEFEFTRIPNYGNSTKSDESRPDIPARTVRTVSSRGGYVDASIDKHGRSSGFESGGAGIPQVSVVPTIRDDGTIKEVAIDDGTGTTTMTFTTEGLVNTLNVPGIGNVPVSDGFWNGGRDITVNGQRSAVSGDGLIRESRGDGVFDHDRTINLATKEESITPVGTGATDATKIPFNVAGSPEGKDYPGNDDTSASWLAGGVLDNYTIGRGAVVDLAYSDQKPSPDQFRDLWKISYPSVVSGPFDAYGVTEEFGHDAAGRPKTVSDASGTRTISYLNARLKDVDYTSGQLLGGYEVKRLYSDGSGRQTGFEVLKNGSLIHSAAYGHAGATAELSTITSGGLTATFERDNGNATGPRLITRITRTGGVHQRFARDLTNGGRITHADTKDGSGVTTVSGAPGFVYSAWDSHGRRTGGSISGGRNPGSVSWNYTDGQLDLANSPMGNFAYAFDAWGRRASGIGASPDPNQDSDADLNQLFVLDHGTRQKKLYITTALGADLWVNGSPITPYDGGYIHPLSPPPGGASGWVGWVVRGEIEDGGDSGAHEDAVAELAGHVYFPPEEESFNYDGDGNRQDSSQWDYGWDSRNRLVRARTKDWETAPSGWDVKFDYDAEGRRFKKETIRFENGEVVESKVIVFVWDGWDLVYERHQDGFGNLLFDRKYVWGPDISGTHGGAGGAGGLLMIRETKGQTQNDYYPIYDGSGHVVGLSDTVGDLVAEYWHGTFGELIEATGPVADANPWRYATKYYDKETGLYYFGQRYFDPITGQWLSREPLGEGESFNLYAYCHNDPVNNVDLHGLRERWVTDPKKPFVMKDGEWHLNEIVFHTADWFWQDSKGLLRDKARIGRKAGKLDKLGWYLVDGEWTRTPGNRLITKTAQATGWDGDTEAELTALATGGMASLIAAPAIIAYAPGAFAYAGQQGGAWAMVYEGALARTAAVGTTGVLIGASRDPDMAGMALSSPSPVDDFAAGLNGWRLIAGDVRAGSSALLGRVGPALGDATEQFLYRTGALAYVTQPGRSSLPSFSRLPNAYMEKAFSINMLGAPPSSAVNAAGFPRNSNWFWRQMLKRYPQLFSPSNALEIRSGAAPVVDDQWVQFFPTHSGFKNDPLIHHHLDQNAVAIPLPRTVHEWFHSSPVLHPDLSR